jgi:hypothetical protein
MRFEAMAILTRSPDAKGTGVPTLVHWQIGSRERNGDIMMSPELIYMLEPIGGVTAIGLAARYTVQLVAICRAKRDDVPKVASAIWGKSRRWWHPED